MMEMDDSKKSPEQRVEPKPKLSREQMEAVRLVVTNRQNVFITGSAGTGKSFVLQRIVDEMKKVNNVYVQLTAFTGIASVNIGGETIHRFLGIERGEGSVEDLVKRSFKYGKVRGIRTVRCLVIDEISMMPPKLFHKIDQMMRIICRKEMQPFGGVQMVFVGDFCQLEPIQSYTGEKRQRKEITSANTLKREPYYAFESAAWKETVQHVVLLRKNQRQSDIVLADILAEIRTGKLSNQSMEILKRRVNRAPKAADGVEPTYLMSRNATVDKMNFDRLGKLPGAEMTYPRTHSITGKQTPAIKKRLQFILSQCNAPENLSLKIGAQVMLIRNLDVQGGLCNGSRGVVVKFIGEGDHAPPLIRFSNGHERVIDTESWQFASKDFQRADPYSGKKAAGWCMNVIQIPLRLAWALTIHKSQGCTIPCVVADLGEVFARGQAYVALSRVPTLDGLCIRNLDARKFMVDPVVVDYYASLENQELMEG